MNYQWVSQPSPTPSAPTPYGPMSQPTSLVAPSIPYGTVPTMQIPLPQTQPVQPVLPHPQLQYASPLPPTTLPPQMNPIPNTHLVQIPSTFHTLRRPTNQTHVLLGVPQP